MRKVVSLLLIMFLASCATKTTVLYSGKESASFSSKCNDICKNKIKESYKDIRFGMYGAKISGLVILEIDGKKGENMYGGYPKYNDSWAFNYNIVVSPGVHELRTKVNNYMVYESEKLLKIRFDEGSKYFLGHIIEIEGEGRVYRWKPVLFNYTSGRLVEIENTDWYGNMSR